MTATVIPEGTGKSVSNCRIPSRNIYLSIIVEEIPTAKPSGSQAGSWRRRDFPGTVEAGYHEAY